jgi:hypothetical protein
VGKEKGEPLRLAFRAREGLVLPLWVRKRRNNPSISRFKRERGVGNWNSWENPSISHFERGRGKGVVGRGREEKHPSDSCFE